MSEKIKNTNGCYDHKIVLEKPYKSSTYIIII